MSELRGSCVLRRSRKPRGQRTLVGRWGANPVRIHDPLVRRSECRPNASTHFTLVGFRSDENRAEGDDLGTLLKRVVVRPAARPVVVHGTAKRNRDCSADG
jgi:hypothetical protein